MRFGVCVGKGSALTNGPRIDRDLFVRTPEELKAWHAEVSTALSSSGNGAYNLCVKIFGEDGSRFLVQRAQFPDLLHRTGQKRLAGPSTLHLDTRPAQR